MRRSDREIKDREAILRVMEKCDVCRIALNGEDYPYILPLNFGLEVREGEITLYFHGAGEGTKFDLIARDSRASFEMDCAHRLVLDEEKGTCTMEYESVIGRGRIFLLPDGEKERALRILMRHYGREDFPYGTAILPQTTVFKLTVEQITGKARKVKKPMA